MSALDNMNTRRMLELISRDIATLLNVPSVPDTKLAEQYRLRALDYVRNMSLRCPGEIEITGSGTLTSFILNKRGHVIFSDAQGAVIEYKSPRSRSRRLIKRWARRQLGIVLMGVVYKAVMPVNSITLNFTVSKNESTHQLGGPEEHDPVQGRVL